jgi:glycosyltransferase involved in cell wall biosynthesis
MSAADETTGGEAHVSAKVLLIPDEPHWALDKNARDLVKYNDSELQLDVCYFRDFIDEPQRFLQSYDLVFPMYMGLFFAMLRHGIPTDKVVTGVRSFHRWDRGRTRPPGYNVRPPRSIVRRLRRAVLVNTHCRKLWHIFSKYVPLIHTKYTCDMEVFYPEEAGGEPSGDLMVGWAGSLSNHPGKRGYRDLIEPVCASLPGVALRVQIREDSFVTDDDRMRAFYNSLDLYICASRSEGTPRPVLEASACGVPVLSTDVGIIPELIEDGHNGFIVERTREAIGSRLRWLRDHRDVLPAAGRAARERMERDFNWKTLIGQWTAFLVCALERVSLRAKGQRL